MGKQVRGCEKVEQAGGALIQNKDVREGLLEEAMLEQRPEDEWTFTWRAACVKAPRLSGIWRNEGAEGRPAWVQLRE